MKKKVHVVSHSHWDREWYLPLENLRMRLVDLIDNVIEASDDDRFKSFQLDGHFLPVEDYLEVKPQSRKKVHELIKSGKIKVGPWYILQDSFLTSGESNIRNLEIGIKASRLIGKPAMIGYFPDTFGNIGQAPQILKKAGIDNAFFGRGVKATGFANAVIEDYSSRNSELKWKSPDGSEILGVLLANWYCNGVDMPSDPKSLKAYLDIKIRDMEMFASTRHLLLMNGCDHSPVQKNIGEIIEIANTLYDDYEFVHSDLEQYVKEVNEEVDATKLDTVVGELRSQMTDGWGTLTNTSSSRYDLKEMNQTIEMRIEEVIQPLFTLFVDKEKYPHDKLLYVYRHLLSNHTHDAICGCSIDSVHEGNMRRFKDCMETLDYLEDQAKTYIRKNFKKEADGIAFNVMNTTAYKTRKKAEVIIDIEKRYSQGFSYHEDIKALQNINLAEFTVKDKEKSYPVKVEDLGVNFGYDLPDSTFRRPYFARQVKIEFICELEAFESRQFTLTPNMNSTLDYIKMSEKIADKKITDEIADKKINKEDIVNKIYTTDYYDVVINKDSSLNIRDKRNNKTYNHVLMLEDSGDIGNEYIYKEADDKKRFKGSEILDIKVKDESEDSFTFEIFEKMNLPVSADELLLSEQRYLVDIKDRKAKRNTATSDMLVRKTIRFDRHSSTIEVDIQVDNNIKDHRLRVLIGHDISTEDIYAESIFEVAKRRTKAPKTWTNEDFTQNFNRFVQMKDEDGGFTVGSIGVQEYENKEEGLYLTLLRATGELGDWGYFPTEDSQMIKKVNFKLYLDFFTDDAVSSQARILSARVPYVTTQVEGLGKIRANQKLDINIGKNMFSTLYINDDKDRILRIYNPNDKSYEYNNIFGKEYNIIGTEAVNTEEFNKSSLSAYEIRTLKLED